MSSRLLWVRDSYRAKIRGEYEVAIAELRKREQKQLESLSLNTPKTSKHCSKFAVIPPIARRDESSRGSSRGTSSRSTSSRSTSSRGTSSKAVENGRDKSGKVNRSESRARRNTRSRSAHRSATGEGADHQQSRTKKKKTKTKMTASHQSQPSQPPGQNPTIEVVDTATINNDNDSTSLLAQTKKMADASNVSRGIVVDPAAIPLANIISPVRAKHDTYQSSSSSFTATINNDLDCNETLVPVLRDGNASDTTISGPNDAAAIYPESPPPAHQQLIDTELPNAYEHEDTPASSSA